MHLRNRHSVVHKAYTGRDTSNDLAPTYAAAATLEGVWKRVRRKIRQSGKEIDVQAEFLTKSTVADQGLLFPPGNDGSDNSDGLKILEVSPLPAFSGDTITKVLCG